MALSNLGVDRVISQFVDRAIEWPIFLTMDMTVVLQALFHSGLAVDIALTFIVLEFSFLLWRTHAASRKVAALNLILALGPGAFLMLALRCALTEAGLIWVAFWLAMSLPLHIADVVKRRL